MRNILRLLYLPFGLIGWVLHELAHILTIFLFWPFSSHVRSMYIHELTMNIHQFGLAIGFKESKPKTVNDCVIRFLIAMAPLILGIFIVIGLFTVDSVSQIDYICKISVGLSLLLLWPSKPDWGMAKYSIFRIWYCFWGEEKTYNQVADAIAEAKYGKQEMHSTPKKGKSLLKVKIRK
jgi:hypothetical protein